MIDRPIRLRRLADLRPAALLAAAVLAAAFPVAAAQRHRGEEVSREFEKTIPLTRGTLTIEHHLGDVEIRTHSLPSVIVKADIEVASRSRANAQEIANAIRIVAEPTPGGVSISTEYPAMAERGRPSVSVDYEITMPDRIPLVVRNRFGHVEVHGLQANANVSNAYGGVSLVNCRGSQKVENSFASVEVTGLRGDAVVQNSNGSVEVSDVTGTVNVSSRFGSLEITNVSGPVVATSSNGSAEVADVGQASLTNAFGSLVAERIRGNLDVTSANGRTTVEQVSGNATLTTSFDVVRVSGVNGNLTCTGANGKIEASDVRGNATVTNTSGPVTVREVGGTVRVVNANGSVNVSSASGGVNVRTTSAPVFLREVGGPIDVETQHGSVSIEEMLAVRDRSCRPISVKSSYGSIHVALPAGAAYDLSASTSAGRITSELPVAGSAGGGESMRGRIGRGGCPLVLSNQNGSIVIDGEE